MPRILVLLLFSLFAASYAAACEMSDFTINELRKSGYSESEIATKQYRYRQSCGQGEVDTSLMGSVRYTSAYSQSYTAPVVRSFSRFEPANRSSDTIPYYSLFEKYARFNDLPLPLVLAVAENESAFDPNAVSPKGAKGLMQLRDDTARQMGVTDIFDPEDNIRGGTKYLRRMLDRWGGDVDLALASYNAGPGAVEDAGNRIPPFEETIKFVARVKRSRTQYSF